ncbi:hypothetical protein ACR34G_01690 [Mycoplasma sp. 480]|uniref:hypothetical protein n=1 Tax=Mycoplasma sp. 480 TaxID=3440155 RepID=UPI003F5173F2
MSRTKEIIFSAFVLALIVISKFIEKIIPDLPNGLGNIAKIHEIVILISSIAFGVLITIIPVLIYLVIISPIFSAFFISGIFYVENIQDKIGVYFLDYFLPLILIALIGIFKKIKNLKLILFSYAITILILLSHSTSGYIYFKEYLKPVKELEILYFLLSFGLNLLSYVLFFVSLPLLVISSKILRKHFMKH